ncbi:Oidioi.mRNA.OKI2018_I69.PAR.g9607.t1.cds [Oikopleura dioica]|uniref:Oidioi.mRNA.OKI2018_I69.PAR.g9607.t1.cds n=1 Tax=Oikopleura dioica TaxID=34765 RepID=A0ABN7RP88_OIKDI|nr:Oidioi.mRNA.OKI2018_I69.PAR.g9607.t1.cds [Oikopleura dioica]
MIQVVENVLSYSQGKVADLKNLQLRKEQLNALFLQAVAFLTIIAQYLRDYVEKYEIAEKVLQPIDKHFALARSIDGKQVELEVRFTIKDEMKESEKIEDESETEDESEITENPEITEEISRSASPEPQID